MKLIVNVESNIWKDNDWLRQIFHDLYKRDKTRGKDRSNRVLTIIYYLEHPDSPFETDKREEVLDMFKQSGFLNFEWSDEKYKDTIDTFNRVILTKPQRILKTFERKFLERIAFIDSIPYNEASHEMIDKIMTNTDKMWKFYNQAVKDVEKEKEEQTSGGLIESAQEEGRI